MEFLSGEITLEKSNEKAPAGLPAINGFEIKKADSAEIKLVKKNANETSVFAFSTGF